MEYVYVISDDTHGRVIPGVYRALSKAIDHAQYLATEERGAEVIAHSSTSGDGRITNVWCEDPGSETAFQSHTVLRWAIH